MQKKMMKALKDLNGYIDNDREKLCDELHEIKLSHKRMERLLRMTLTFLDGMFDDVPAEIGLVRALELQDRIKRELSYPGFRVQYRMKGGKDA